MEYAKWVILLLATLGLFLSSWIIIPAPNLTLFPLAVGAPEISPLLLVGNVSLFGIALLLPPTNLLRYLAIGCSIAGIIISSLPLLQLPATIQQANARMQAALGVHYQAAIPPAQQRLLRPRPFRLLALIQGMNRAVIEPERRYVSYSGQPALPSTDAPTLAFDIYRPPSTEKRPGPYPTLITIYGGAWQTGDPSKTSRFSTYMAAQGYVVVAIDYRHAPTYQFPAQLQDVQTALHWIAQQASAYDIDLTRLALVGWSSGAHLALLTAYQASDLAVDFPIRAVVDYYGPVNLTEGYRDLPVPDPIDVRSVLTAFLGGTPDEHPQLYKTASPIHHVRPNLPATLMIYGDRDHLVKPIFGQQLNQHLQETGNQAVLIQLPWAEHAFDALFQGIGNQITLYYVERFLAWTLR